MLHYAARVTGERARRFGRVAVGLGLAVVLLSLGGGALTWHIASVLLACRAG